MGVGKAGGPPIAAAEFEDIMVWYGRKEIWKEVEWFATKNGR